MIDSISAFAWSIIWRVVMPGLIREMIALQYSRMNCSSSRCHGA